MALGSLSNYAGPQITPEERQLKNEQTRKIREGSESLEWKGSWKKKNEKEWRWEDVWKELEEKMF